MKYVLYARKSTEDAKKQIQSIDDQIKELQTLSNKMGVEIDSIISESGSAKVRGRKGFNELVRKIEFGECDSILCWDLDRLARNMPDGAIIMHLLQTGRLKEIRTPFNTYDQNTDTILLSISFGMATDYSRKLSKNVKRGMLSRAREGYHMFVPPTGYIAKGKGVRDLNPNNYIYIVKLFTEFKKGKRSVFNILKSLTAEGLRSNSGKELSLTNAYSILRNPFYKGYMILGDEIYKGNHPAMISEKMFDKIQLLIKGKKRGVEDFKQRTNKFSKTIKCGCGRMMTSYDKKGNTYYSCQNKKCSATYTIKDKEKKTIREDELIDNLSNRFPQLPIAGKERIKKALMEVFKDNKAQEGYNKKVFRQQIKKEESKLYKLDLKMINDELSSHSYESLSKQIRNRISSLKKEEEKNSNNNRDEFQQKLKMFTHIDNFIELLFNKITISGESLKADLSTAGLVYVSSFDYLKGLSPKKAYRTHFESVIERDSDDLVNNGTPAKNRT